MTLGLRLILSLLGIAAILISFSILGLGAGATAQAFETVFDRVTGYTGPHSGPWSPTADSELRFYAALWGAYGLALIMTARRLRAYLDRVPWLPPCSLRVDSDASLRLPRSVRRTPSSSW